jgi:hypothetical protein
MNISAGPLLSLHNPTSMQENRLYYWLQTHKPYAEERAFPTAEAIAA